MRNYTPRPDIEVEPSGAEGVKEAIRTGRAKSPIRFSLGKPFPADDLKEAAE